MPKSIHSESNFENAPNVKTMKSEDGETISYHFSQGKSPGVIFLGGFASDMTGTKALALERHCQVNNRSFVRFDYRGHGASTGTFSDGTIGAWLRDATLILDKVTKGPQVLVGSSMGGWIMLLLALARPARITGLIGVAAAPDFTERLLWDKLPDEAKSALQLKGKWENSSEYSDQPYVITQKLIEEGRNHLLLDGPIDINVPVRLIHGMCDPEVPWYYAQGIQDRLNSTDVTAILIKDGDHRLSRDEDLERLCRELDMICDYLG